MKIRRQGRVEEKKKRVIDEDWYEKVLARTKENRARKTVEETATEEAKRHG